MERNGRRNSNTFGTEGRKERQAREGGMGGRDGREEGGEVIIAVKEGVVRHSSITGVHRRGIVPEFM